MIPDLPGWDSLSAVTRYHSWAELVGIAFLALLVIAEVVSYKTGHRKDYLTEKQQTATDQRHDEDMARLHVDAENALERAQLIEHENLSLRKEILEVQQKIGPQDLDRELATIAGNNLQQHCTKLRARVNFNRTEDAAGRLSTQLSAFLTSAGIDNGVEPRPNAPEGIVVGVEIRAPPEAAVCAEKMAAALNSRER